MKSQRLAFKFQHPNLTDGQHERTSSVWIKVSFFCIGADICCSLWGLVDERSDVSMFYALFHRLTYLF